MNSAAAGHQARGAPAHNDTPARRQRSGPVPLTTAILQRAVVLAVALAVGPALIATALLVLAHPRTIDAAYALPGFPEPRIAIAADERSRLGAIGARAIQPWQDDAVQRMRAATHDDGRRAFDRKALAHFEDVRAFMLLFLLAGGTGVAVIALAAALVGERSVVRRGLSAGTRLTVALFAVIGLLMLLGFGAFFDAFHELFFEGDTWKLPPLGTVRSLYPDALWQIVGGAFVALVLAQAAAIEVALRRRDAPPDAATRSS